MPPDAHPSLSRSISAENRRLPASGTQNARPPPPLPKNASALHRWKIFPFRTGRQCESAFLLSPRSGAQPPPRKTTSPPMARVPNRQRRCFRRQHAPQRRPSSTQRFQTRTATRSMPSCPTTCRAMAQSRLCLSTRRLCVQAPKEACALGGTLPLYYISAPPACQRPSSKTSPIVEMAATFMNCFVQSPAGRRFPGRHSKALPGPPQ